jgi:hypothetical protein
MEVPMKNLVAKVIDKSMTHVANKLAKTGCFWGCSRLEIPEELL